MNTIELPQTIYLWEMDIDYGHKSSMGWIYSTFGPDDLDKMEDYVQKNMNNTEDSIVYADQPNPDGTHDHWIETFYETWMPNTNYITEITDPDEILRRANDRGIVGFNIR